MGKRVAVVAFVALLALGQPSCITDPVTGKSVIGLPMSDEEEIAEGLTYASSFKAQYEGAYPDPDLQQYCGSIVLGMAKASHRPHLPWNFTILNSSEVNAFALPGGTVCITRGLLWRMEDEAEFAGVMGHEIGHVTHRHSVQAMGRQAILGIVLTGASIAAESSESEWAALGMTLGAVGGQLLLLKYGRDQETESDMRGVEYSLAAGYDPREMADVFREFQALKAESGGDGPVWLSSHPLDEDRIDNVLRESLAREPRLASSSPGLVKTRSGWTERLARLRQAQKVYDEYDQANAIYAKAVQSGDRAALTRVLQTLESCRLRLPNHALFTSGVGVVNQALGRTADAKRYFETAARMQPDLFEPHIQLAAIAFSANDRAAALDRAVRAREIFPIHPAPYYYAARVYDQMGDAKKALASYQQVLQLAPEESEEYKVATERSTALGGAR